jgi:hypothetical protein
MKRALIAATAVVLAAATVVGVLLADHAKAAGSPLPIPVASVPDTLPVQGVIVHNFAVLMPPPTGVTPRVSQAQALLAYFSNDPSSATALLAIATVPGTRSPMGNVADWHVIRNRLCWVISWAFPAARTLQVSPRCLLSPGAPPAASATRRCQVALIDAQTGRVLGRFFTPEYINCARR